MPTRTAQIQEDTHFKIMRNYQNNPDQAQRELAHQVGISLGSLHDCLKALMDKGFVKLDNFQTASTNSNTLHPHPRRHSPKNHPDQPLFAAQDG